MHWLFLFIAGLFEIMWAIGLVYTQGFTKLLPSIFTVVSTIASFYFFSLALRHLPLGTSYAVWTGIGTVGTVILGIVLFNESTNLFQLFFIGLILVGILGLRLVTPA